MPSSQPLTDRLLELLDAAYDAPGDQAAFDRLFRTAEKYFYGSEPRRTLSSDLPCDDTLNLNGHITRIQKLSREHVETPLENLERTFGADAAAIVIPAQSPLCHGNGAASALFDLPFPTDFANLPFTPETRDALSALRRTFARNGTISSGFLPFVIESSNVRVAGRYYGVNDRDGGQYLCLALAYNQWRESDLDFTTDLYGLTSTEISVLALLLNGHSHSEIASLRGRSVETVKSHAKRLLRKTGRHNMTELTHYVATLSSLRTREPTPPPEYPEINLNEERILKLEDGRQLSYYMYGDGAGRPVLFFHGLLAGPFFTERAVQLFRKHNLCVYAPSRPGFGRTDSQSKNIAYKDQCTRDALRIMNEVGGKDWLFLAHQGGASYAFRAAAAAQERIRGLGMIGAGVPIDPKRDLADMNRQTRVAAAAIIHAPAIMEMLLHIGIAAYKRLGPKLYLQHFFSDDPIDLAALDDPEIFPTIERGALHMIAQGAKPFIEDGKPAMEDWSADYDAVTLPQVWVHGLNDPVLKAETVERFIKARRGLSVTPIEYAGFAMLYQYPEAALEPILSRFG